ncbi:MAG: stage V sporulation T C-terminal domain-containing protein [Christensenellales bacterium]
MKATGVVRRIDELGRIVIPKEIRRTLKIKNGTPLEIYSGENGELLLKKYSPILEISDFASEVAESIFKATELSVFVTNMEKIISCNGANKNTYINRQLDSGIEKAINYRTSKIYDKANLNTSLFGEISISNFAVCPITNAGDVFGAIILFNANKEVTLDNLKLGQAFAEFLGKQVG